MSESVSQHDVAVLYENKIEEGNSWWSQYMVEYKIGQKTENLNCIKCGRLIKSLGSSTSPSTKHVGKGTGSLQSAIQETCP